MLKIPDSEKKIAEGGLRLQGLFKESSGDKPLISIVTVVYNGAEFLEDTIKSVLEQKYDNVEYIIVDGGSTDGTLDIISSYSNFIDYWVSEPDSGIYDAMNKGILLSTGSILGIINSDDYYAGAECLNTVVSALNEGAEVVCGAMDLISRREDETKVLERRIVKWKKLPFGMYINHPSTFVKRHVYARMGLYDSSLRMAADYKMFLKCYVENIKFRATTDVLAVMRDGGESIRRLEITREEESIVRRSVLPKLHFVIVMLVKFLRNSVR